MNIQRELRDRFRPALQPLSDDVAELLDLIRPAQDAKFGDYQANCAMPLGKRLGQPPREVAALIVKQLDVADMCGAPEIAGPGFINLQLNDEWIVRRLARMVGDQRLGVTPTKTPRTYVIDYSSPNVAKPMHVGHIRSTVIGDALCRTLRFLGHRVISDNHLGDWGTQFGMIIYGYKHFVDAQAYARQPVVELGRLYKLVSRLVEFHTGAKRLPKLEETVAERESEVARLDGLAPPADKAARKKSLKALRHAQNRLHEACEEIVALRAKMDAVRSDPSLAALADRHTDVATAVLDETAKLHAGDAENHRLWDEFLPHCRTDIQRIYDRIDIHFDYEHGESFYNQQLAGVVEDFERRGLAQESEEAVCVFLDGFSAPMIIRKKDGAYLYATTDLATIQYRTQTWQPDAILYVVDHRQGEHFAKLFAAARLWGYQDVELRHVKFGTVLGEDGKPYKTRSGDTVGLEGLLDDAVAKAYSVVCKNDDSKPDGAELSEAERKHIADVVGPAAVKYADLSQNRESDYVFSFDKMVALEGNTATYMQYSYARTQSIFAKGAIDVASLRSAGAAISLEHPLERSLAIQLLRFHEALDESVADYRPNQLTAYLYELAARFSKFYNGCKVLKAETDSLRTSRLLLCDLTGRTIRQGLALLGIDVVDKM